MNNRKKQGFSAPRMAHAKRKNEAISITRSPGLKSQLSSRKKEEAIGSTQREEMIIPGGDRRSLLQDLICS